jgi:hypothetical protein
MPFSDVCIYCLEVVKFVYAPITDPYTGIWGPRKLDRFLKWIPRFNFREIQILGKKFNLILNLRKRITLPSK